VRDDRLRIRSARELRQTVSKVANTGKDQSLSKSLRVSSSIYHLGSCSIEVILQARGKSSTYISFGHVLGLLDPFDGPTKLFDGVDEGTNISSNIVEEVDRRHYRIWLE